MRVFVSYSHLDGIVTTGILRSLHLYLESCCKPFIHCLAERESKWEQLCVISSLATSHAVLIIGSPAAASSEWVKLEIRIATILRLPVLRLKSQDLVLLHEAEHSHSPEPPSSSLPLPLSLLAAR
jgi:hypothetical protein